MIHVRDQLDARERDWDISKYYDELDRIVKRPPYQRKSVWSTNKKKDLMDSFIRQLYVPPVVLRQIVLDEGSQLRFEVVDGQQRITAIQEFFANEFPLPDTRDLRELHGDYNLGGKYYEDLPEDVQAYINNRCSLRATVLRGIDDPTDRTHQELATQVFWRLQQGESLNTIEENHSKIYSPVRNYIVMRSDNISFNIDEYESRDQNPNRHPFFRLLARENDRLQHLGLLARFLLVEIDDGPTKVTNMEVTKLFDCEREGLVISEDVEDFRKRKEVKRVETMLDLMYELYEETPLKDDDGKVQFLNREYFILTLYTLLRELQFGDYNFSRRHYGAVREFTHDWYKRFTSDRGDDTVMHQFRAASQQNREAVTERHYLIENEFWKSDPEIKEVDSKRLFSRGQRIRLFLESDRVCQICLDDGKDEAEARIRWSEWDADHITAHSEGGETNLENAQVLCPEHNRAKGRT